ncbi:MAG: ferrochelatase [Bacteroidales bacterium]|nr:ferrochelatase [Bacteroidales bacterium]MBN2821521.1 ferrochelatase [Bacteroidales bacterium]
MCKKKGILLVNVGTPDKPQRTAVRKYLTEFLNDPYVIDIPWLSRLLLVNLLIIPFRTRKSTKLYQRLWTTQGSPLRAYLDNLVEKLQQKVNENTRIYGAMRYGNPGMKTVLRQIEKEGVKELIVLPLYPQYATSTTATVKVKLDKELKKWVTQPEIHFISQFYNHPAFIDAFVQNIQQYDPQSYDHILFTFHGLPLRQVDKMHPEISSKKCSCTQKMPKHGKSCYKATCYHTTRLLVEKLKLNTEQYSIGFQSRLSKNWLTPFTDETIIRLAQLGKKKILVVAPSFVSDCLETTVELALEYQKLFLQNGGNQLTLVESLNDKENWADTLIKIFKEY